MTDPAASLPRAGGLRRWLLLACAMVVVAAIAVLNQALPPDLSRYAERSAILLGENGDILHIATTRDGMWRLATTPAEVDPHYLTMLAAAEDGRFRHHFGIDPLALLRAGFQLATRGHIVSGGSTLTMQVARLLEPHRRSIAGKLHDMVRALQLEARYSKDEILAMYLTLAPFGGNVEGVRAASLSWFGHEPGQLTPGEAAILVALPQRPSALRPDRHPDRAQMAARRLLGRLATGGLIPAGDTETPPPPIAIRHRFPRLAPQVAFRLARHDGMAVTTTLDPALQLAVQQRAQESAAAMGDGGDVAILVVENRSRAIRAWVGGTRSALDLARRRRSPGSTLKPFIYGLAFDDLAVLPETLIDDHPLRIGGYAPENFDRGFHGQVTVRDALQQSLNIPAIALLDRVGPGRLAAVLRDAGARLEFPAASPAPTLPLALGGVGISLLDLTRLYVGLAHDGQAAALRIIPEAAMPAPARLMSATAAKTVTDILRGSPPPDGRVPVPLLAGARPIAYKTGTSYGFRDAWAVGYSPRWTIGVWTGRADGTPRPGAYGRNTAAPLLYALFDLLPPEPDDAAPLAEETPAPARIPRALARFADRDASHALPHGAPPRILFPPDGAQLELLDEHGHPTPLQLEADSGTPPYRWSVNGLPVAAPALAALPQWLPDGPGFARVTVTDAAGRRASAVVRVQ